MAPMRRTIPLALLALALSLPVLARADTSVLPHRNCPEGSRSVSGATAEFEVCEPVECNDNSSCLGGTQCQEAPLCIQTAAVGGRKDAIGACSARGSCAYPAACETGKRCVKASVLKRGLTNCGCRVAGGEESDALGGLGLLGALAFGFRRRRP
jgi:MYXO-CTERM domain-containing protein